MADDTLDLSQSLDSVRKLLKITDNGDNTFSIATSSQDSTWFDEILITYVDATKAVISKVEWKLASSVVKTLTPTFGTTTDDWVKS